MIEVFLGTNLTHETIFFYPKANIKKLASNSLKHLMSTLKMTFSILHGYTKHILCELKSFNIFYVQVCESCAKLFHTPKFELHCLYTNI